jgi:hypothetical protein
MLHGLLVVIVQEFVVMLSGDGNAVKDVRIGGSLLHALGIAGHLFVKIGLGICQSGGTQKSGSNGCGDAGEFHKNLAKITKYGRVPERLLKKQESMADNSTNPCRQINRLSYRLRVSGPFPS